MDSMKKVVVFGSAAAAAGSELYLQAERLGSLLQQQGFALVTGGYGGVMEAVLSATGDSPAIGVTVANAARTANPYVKDVIEETTYLNRLAKLAELGDAYVVLSGGTGTLLEFAMVWALRERGHLAAKPIICVGEQWREAVETMSFYSSQMLNAVECLQFVDSVESAAAALRKAFDRE